MTMKLSGTPYEQHIKDLILRLLGPLSEHNIHFFYNKKSGSGWQIDLHINEVSYIYSRVEKIPCILVILDEFNSLFDGKEGHIDVLDFHGGQLVLTVYSRSDPGYVGWDNDRDCEVK